MIEALAANWLPALWSLVGVPILFGAFVEIYYRINLSSTGPLPFQSPRGRVIWFVVFGMCLVSGIACVLRFPFERGWSTIVASGTYAVVMSVVLMIVAVYVSYRLGDSI